MMPKFGARILACAVALVAGTLTLEAAAPLGWLLAGNKPASYDSGVDSRVLYNDQHSAYLKSTEPVLEGFGTLMQHFSAEKYAGQRVRFSAVVKSQSVEDWAGLWMRVDRGQVVVAFDNMQNRAIRGTTDWHPYQVVLDVPQDATEISIGILLSRTGTVWMSSASFEIVDRSVPTTTTSSSHDQPVNLGFEEK